MKQLQIFTIPSPCIGICQSGARGNCLGCFRTRDERFGWTKFTDEEKAHVIKLCAQRKKRSVAKQAQVGQDDAAQKPSQEGFDGF